MGFAQHIDFQVGGATTIGASGYTAGAGSIVVVSAATFLGGKTPTIANPVYLTVSSAATPANSCNYSCTAVTANTLTVTVLSGTDQNFVSGDNVFSSIYAEDLVAIETMAVVVQAAHAAFIGPATGANAAPTFRALVGADLPVPSASTLGGVQSIAAVAHNFLTSISVAGVPAQAQPAFTDISGAITVAQLPGLVPTDIWVGSAGGAAVAMAISGDATMASSGALTVASIGGKAVTLGGALTLSGAFNTTVTVTAGTSVTLPTSGTLLSTAAAVTVGQGGTGDATFTAYSVLCGGTIAAGNLQNVSGLGSSGNVLTSNGAAALPTWQAPSGGGVSSFTGDGTVLSNSASGGAVTATLATAAPCTVLCNNTNSTAAPTYASPGWIGAGSMSGTTTLTANSPSYNLCTGGPYTVTLPAASACTPGKTFWFYSFSGTITISRAGTDTIQAPTGGTASNTISISSNTCASLWTDGAGGAATWHELTYSVLPFTGGGTGTAALGTAWAVLYYGAGSAFASVAGSVGQVLQSGNSAAPSYTSAPGANIAAGFTSVTTQKVISSGTVPTIAGGGTIGSGGTVAFNGTAHDESSNFTVTAGTGATAAVVTITFGNAAYTAAPNVCVTPGNLTAAAIMTAVYATSTTTTVVITLGALVSTSVYTFNVIVKE